MEAIDKLYIETKIRDSGANETTTYGIFRGHPAKPYYQANDFVGILLHSLLELDDPDTYQRGAL